MGSYVVAASPEPRTSKTCQLRLDQLSLKEHSNNPQEKIKCWCSSSKHPLAYKCHYHRNQPKRERTVSSPTPRYTSNNMLLLKTAAKNSMLKKGGKEAEFAEKNFIIKRMPPSLDRPRCKAFQIRPSRLSTMSNALDS